MSKTEKLLSILKSECEYPKPLSVNAPLVAEIILVMRSLSAENAELRAALKALLSRDERNTCQHEETTRGGAIWEICESCGAKWADDKGGKPKWKDPPEWVAARAAIFKEKS